jgi:uncharacterized protein with PQ loop repeat
MEYISYIGLIVLTISWFPQSVETIKRGRSEINLYFLILVAMGSTCLWTYAVSIGNAVFSILNFLSTVGAMLNLYYKKYPRRLQN